MLSFFELQPEIFGVDVNDFSLRIVKLQKKRHGFYVASFCEAAIKPGVVKEGVIQDQESLSKIIKAACANVKGKKLATSYVAVSLPEEKSFSQVIQMPPMDADELRHAVPFEAENYIPLPIEKVYLDYEIINGQKPVNLFINVMPKTIVDTYVSCFKKAGLIPCIMEVESQAMVRALVKKGEMMRPQIIIDFSQTKTSLIIFSGNSIRFTCTIPVSSGQLTEGIANNLRISYDKAEELKIKQGLVTRRGEKTNEITAAMDPILSELAEQVKKYISFYQGHISHELMAQEGTIEKIVLCGGGANLKELSDFLYKKLRIPVQVGNPFINIHPQNPRAKQAISPQRALSFTTALGLALRAAEQQDNL